MAFTDIFLFLNFPSTPIKYKNFYCLLFVSLLSQFWLIHFSSPTPALSTICKPLSSYMCSITPGTVKVSSSYSYCDVIMSPSVSIVYSTFVQAQIEENIKVACYWLLWGNPPPLTGGFPSQRASNAENIPFDDVIMSLRQRYVWRWLQRKHWCLMLWTLTLKHASYELTEAEWHMCQQHRPSLFKIMACRLFGTKPLYEPMLAYCQFDSCE